MQPPAWLLVAVESLANHLLLPQLEFASNRSFFELSAPPPNVWLVTIELLAPMSSATPELGIPAMVPVKMKLAGEGPTPRHPALIGPMSEHPTYAPILPLAWVFKLVMSLED